MSRLRVLLCHPPAMGSGKLQLDGYCSQPQKGPFRWHPLEFIAALSRWSEHADVDVLDLGTTQNSCHISWTDYDIVFGLTGSFGWYEMKDFWQKAIDKGCQLWLSGDIARHEPVFVFRSLPGLCGILPELAVIPSIEEIAEKRRSPAVWCPDQEPYKIPRVPHSFCLGLQPWDKWNPKLYGLPFTGRRFASLLTQVGCPYACKYCMLSSYPPAFRDMDEVAAEIEALKACHVRHLYIRDATINAHNRHFESLLALLQQSGMSWNGFARLEGMGARARELAASGCRTLQLGLDSTDVDALAKSGKLWQSKNEPAKEIALLRDAGIAVAGHFVAGLSEQDRPSEIVRYARSLKLDWMTLSPLAIRPGTALWRIESLDESQGVTQEQARSLRNAHLSFYLRAKTLRRILPAYALRPAVLGQALQAIIGKS